MLVFFFLKQSFLIILPAFQVPWKQFCERKIRRNVKIKFQRKGNYLCAQIEQIMILFVYVLRNWILQFMVNISKFSPRAFPIFKRVIVDCDLITYLGLLNCFSQLFTKHFIIVMIKMDYIVDIIAIID